MALIKTVKGCTPQFGKNCYLAENATITGNVKMGDNCSIWFNAVLRSDVNGIVMGNNVNVQDSACVHQSDETPVIIEDNVSIGHIANVHGCIIKRGALIGMGATVLDGAVIGENAIIAANALVTSNTQVGENEIWAGVPAKCIGKAKPGRAAEYAEHYLRIKTWYEHPTSESMDE